MDGVGVTGMWCAVLRDQESMRVDRLFRDEYAHALTGGAQEVMAGIARRGRLAGNPVLLRTCATDRVIDEELGHGTRQVVMLGSGMDTRPFRLPVPPDTVWYELDVPAVFDHKEPILWAEGAYAGCERRLVPADLTQDWAPRLTDAGFRPEIPTLWLAEGLLQFLGRADIDRLGVTTRRLSAPGSVLLFDAFQPAYWGQRAGQALAGEFRAHSIGLAAVLDDPADWAEAHGWRAEVHTGADVRAGRCGWLQGLPPRATDDFSELVWIVRCRVSRPKD